MCKSLHDKSENVMLNWIAVKSSGGAIEPATVRPVRTLLIRAIN